METFGKFQTAKFTLAEQTAVLQALEGEARTLERLYTQVWPPMEGFKQRAKLLKRLRRRLAKGWGHV